MPVKYGRATPGMFAIKSYKTPSKKVSPALSKKTSPARSKKTSPARKKSRMKLTKSR